MFDLTRYNRAQLSLFPSEQAPLPDTRRHSMFCCTVTHQSKGLHEGRNLSPTIHLTQNSAGPLDYRFGLRWRRWRGTANE